MVELEMLKEPVQCPFCKDKLTELQFLRRIFDNTESPVTIGGKKPVFECDRCHSISIALYNNDI